MFSVHLISQKLPLLDVVVLLDVVTCIRSDYAGCGAALIGHAA
jgi:hypothetical protein